MTLLISWLGVDSRGPASIYIASDSRISWGEKTYWDSGRKVFGFNNHPDIVGYCGDVLFPSQILSQLIDLGDSGLLFSQNDDCKTKFESIKEKIIQLFKPYPQKSTEILGSYLGFIHASRDLQGKFFCHLIEWNRENGWSGKEAEFKDYSDRLLLLGSGATLFKNKYESQWQTKNTRTSRAIFHAFCDALSENIDPHCGGPPQLVGLYRKWNSRKYGIIWNKKRYFLGVNIKKINSYNSIEWRNELFERCDATTMKKIPEAQAQPNLLRSDS